jgi:hypothetical protein
LSQALLCLPDPKHDLAKHVSLGEVLVRLGRFLERIYRRDGHLQLRGRYSADEAREFLDVGNVSR